MSSRVQIFPVIGILVGLAIAVYGIEVTGGFNGTVWLGIACMWVSFLSLLMWTAWELLCPSEQRVSPWLIFTSRNRRVKRRKIIAYSLGGIFASALACSLCSVSTWTVNAVVSSTGAITSVRDYFTLVYDSIALLLSAYYGIRYFFLATLVFGAAVGGLIGLCRIAKTVTAASIDDEGASTR